MVELVKESDSSDGFLAWKVSEDSVRLEELLDAIHNLGIEIEDVSIEAGGFPMYLTMDIRK